MKLKSIPEVVGKKIKSLEIIYEFQISRGVTINFDDGTFLFVNIMSIPRFKVEATLFDIDGMTSLMELKDYRGPCVKELV